MWAADSVDRVNVVVWCGVAGRLTTFVNVTMELYNENEPTQMTSPAVIPVIENSLPSLNFFNITTFDYDWGDNSAWGGCVGAW